MSLVNNLIADGLRERNERLVAALRDAHALIPNELVGPWVAAHKLDGILQQTPAPEKSSFSMEPGPVSQGFAKRWNDPWG